jgi:sec-independent protein translocase protein TatB
MLVFVSAARGQLSLPFMGPHPPILLGTIGMTDSLILMVLALVVFGPRRLPQIGRQIGKLMYEFRKASNDFKFQMEEELRNAEEADRRKKEEERQRSLAALAAAEQASVSADPVPALKSSESPYPGETNYPEQYPAESASCEQKVEESTPRIMPPAVGETIPAERPTRAFSESTQGTSETPAGSSPASSQTENSTEPPSGQNPGQNEAAEALNQHG